MTHALANRNGCLLDNMDIHLMHVVDVTQIFIGLFQKLSYCLVENVQRCSARFRMVHKSSITKAVSPLVAL